MPAHVQNLLVEVNSIGVGLLAHACTLAGWTVGSAVALLAVLGAVHGRGDADLLRLESALICLQNNFSVLAGLGRVDHEIVVV